MHYIAVLYERTQQSRAAAAADIKLRGYNLATWVPADFLRLPVYALAYALCPKFRDIYFEWVKKRSRQPTWERYQGRVIDEVYKLIHLKCEKYASATRSRDFALYSYLLSAQEEILGDAKNRHRSALSAINPPPSEEEIEAFDKGLKKIITFEAEITSAFMNFEIARLRDASPNRVFREHFDFNTNLSLGAKNQGFTSPAIPDFVYRHEVIGDIKSGAWQRFFEYTVIAYALAYEEHTQRNMNYGAILHVQLPNNRLVPAHYEADIIYLDDSRRRKFLAMRNRKLEIITEGIDPGKPDNPSECTGCFFYSDCWGEGSG